MSAATAAQAIDDAVDRVQLAALNKLAARLEEETDPLRLERLLAIAVRVRRSAHADGPAPLSRRAAAALRDAEGDTADEARDARRSKRAPTTTPTPPQPRTNQPRQASTNDEDELSLDDLPEGPADPLPLAQPMTDDEFHQLFKEVGLTEAHRRRLIRANLVDEQRKRSNSS